MNKYWKHFKTITKHKWYVMKACFKAGIYWQGLTHDLSKYSITEFSSSAAYFQGDKSPIKVEKIKNGYSFAWQHHQGVNKHHWQYWIDFEHGELIVIEMPAKYVIEMLCDWIGAGKAYNKGQWTINSFKSWYNSHRDTIILHTLTKEFIDLLMYSVESEEELFKWLKVDRVELDRLFVMQQGGGYQPRITLNRNEKSRAN